jgi:peptidoglycan hydrolase-like protein with peptidoglycan-binding domain
VLPSEAHFQVREHVMTKPRTLAAILVLGALTTPALVTPALAQEASGSDNSPQPAASEPSGASQSPGSQSDSSNPQLPAAGALNSTAGTNARQAGLRNPVMEVQERLQQLGLYNGDIDGKWGPQTRGAVVEFQRSHGLRPTGTLGVATIARLNQTTQNPQSANPQSAQSNDTGQEPTPDTGATGGNTVAVTPPAQRHFGGSNLPGSATSPGGSTAARATITGPGLGYGTDTFAGNAPPAAGVATSPEPSFFGSSVDLSNGYNAAVSPNRR